MNRSAADQQRSGKLKQLLYGFSAFVFVIIIRLFYLQVNKSSVFCSLGEGNFLRTEVIPPLRGNLLDCNNVLLAANRPVFNLFWQGGLAGQLTEQSVALLKKLETIVNTSLVNDATMLELRIAERYGKRVL